MPIIIFLFVSIFVLLTLWAPIVVSVIGSDKLISEPGTLKLMIAQPCVVIIFWFIAMQIAGLANPVVLMIGCVLIVSVVGFIIYRRFL